MADLTNCRNLEHWIVERFSRFLLLIWRLTLNRFQMNRDIGRIRAELLYKNTCPCLSGFIFNFIIMIIINTLLEKIQWRETDRDIQLSISLGEIPRADSSATCSRRYSAVCLLRRIHFYLILLLHFLPFTLKS